MILAHEDSYCPGCKTATLGPSCHWCAGTQTVRFSPAEELRRYAGYRRFRARGVTHADALKLLDQVAELLLTGHAANNLAVRELVHPAPPAVSTRAPIVAIPAAVAA
jgi:hypothetical protein